jgi:hypothetical protein
LLRSKRKARESTRNGRLELAVPESADLLERAFAEGESAAQQSAQLLDLLDRYGAPRNAPRRQKLFGVTRRAPLRLPSCCASPISPRRCRST